MRALLSDFLDHSLHWRTARGLEAHLAGCPPCAGYVASVERTILLYRERPVVDVPPAVRGHLREVLRERHESAPRTFRCRHPLPSIKDACKPQTALGPLAALTARDELSALPPLVFAGECDVLATRLQHTPVRVAAAETLPTWSTLRTRTTFVPTWKLTRAYQFVLPVAGGR